MFFFFFSDIELAGYSHLGQFDGNEVKPGERSCLFLLFPTSFFLLPHKQKYLICFAALLVYF